MNHRHAVTSVSLPDTKRPESRTLLGCADAIIYRTAIGESGLVFGREAMQTQFVSGGKELNIAAVQIKSVERDLQGLLEVVVEVRGHHEYVADEPATTVEPERSEAHKLIEQQFGKLTDYECEDHYCAERQGS